MGNRFLDMLFLKKVDIDKDCFLNLYYSYDDLSFIGIDLDILNKFKTYDKYKILLDNAFTEYVREEYNDGKLYDYNDFDKDKNVDKLRAGF
ncbi:MAG: hypothetical protein K6E20_04070, partial [Acholeplasmatales bacterium]|nr:hypothetical protein [Acholeplasmatales bacterium]